MWPQSRQNIENTGKTDAISYVDGKELWRLEEQWHLRQKGLFE